MAITEFQQYAIEAGEFFAAEKKKETWMWLGILTYMALAGIGAYLLPAVHLIVWSITILVSSIFIFVGLITVWLSQRKFSSFNRWKKYKKRHYQADIGE
jgi:hypothetical protein